MSDSVRRVDLYGVPDTYLWIAWELQPFTRVRLQPRDWNMVWFSVSHRVGVTCHEYETGKIALRAPIGGTLVTFIADQNVEKDCAVVE